MTNEDVVQPRGDNEQAMRTAIADALTEYLELQKNKSEPAYKAELEEERRKREALERRLNDLAEENRHAKQRAEEAERSASIRTELQKLGVAKVDLAFRAVKDDITRSEDGRLIAREGQRELEVKEYLTKFVQENPELLPPRMSGGAGTNMSQKSSGPAPALDIDRIKPGMDPRELEQLRKEIARIASQPANR